MINDNFSGTPATLTGEEIYPQLYRTQDAAEMAGIKAAESRTARRIFLKIAGRLNFSPADERREAKGGSPQKFWTREQIDIVAAEYAKNLPTVTLADRARRINKFIVDTQKNFISIGNELIAAKAEIPHGNWTKWLEENFQWHERTARRFMAIADRFGKTDNVVRFQPSTLQAMLALPVGTEQEFIDEQAAADNPVENQSARQVQAAVKQFKARKKISAPVIVGKPAQIDSPVIDVDADFGNTKLLDSAEDSATVIAPADDVQIDSERVNDIEPAQDSEPANGIDRDNDADNLAAVFKLIWTIKGADNLRRIRELADARLAAISAEDSASVNDIKPVIDSATDSATVTNDTEKQTDFDSEPVNEIEIDRATFNTILLHAEKISNGQVDFVPILQRELNGLAQIVPVVVPVVDLCDRVQDFISQLPLIIRDDDCRYRLIKLAENSFELDLIAVPAVSDDSDIAGKKIMPTGADEKNKSE